MLRLDSPLVTTAIVVIKAGILVFGGLISYLSYKAYRRTQAPALRALAFGFAIITVGTFVAGLLDQVFKDVFGLSVLVDSLLTLLGFAVITYSLYRE